MTASARLLAIALLLHESVYLADWGLKYYRRSFAPAFGLRISGRARIVVSVVYLVAITLQVTCATLLPARAFLLVMLVIVIAAFPVRLSNHLVVALFLQACLVLLSEPPWAAAASTLVALSFLLAGFAKLNRTYLFSQNSCGVHFAQVLARSWRLSTLSDSPFVARLGSWGMVALEIGCGIGLLLPAPARDLAFVIALVLAASFASLCHVHFGAVLLAGLSACLPSSAWHAHWLWLAVAVPGAAAAVAVGNWRTYPHRRVAAVNQAAFGGLFGIFVIVAVRAIASHSLLPLSAASLGFTAWVLIGMFALNGLCVYLGIKSSYSLAMFSNLRPDRWDHLVVRRPLISFKARYRMLPALRGLPNLYDLRNDSQLRRLVSELYLSEYRTYSELFILEIRRTLDDEGYAVPTALAIDLPPRIMFQRFPLTIPSDNSAVCE